MILSILRRLTMWLGLAVLLLVESNVSADEETHLAPIVDWQDHEFIAFESMEESEGAELLLAQTQPPTVTEARPQEPRRAQPSGRRRRRTYRLPPMFGDFFGGGTYHAVIQPPAVVIQQTIVDGVSPVNIVREERGR